MSNWPLSMSSAPATIGPAYTLITGGASATTYSAWGQLIASAEAHINGLLLSMESVAGNYRRMVIDVGVGASGAEVVVASKIPAVWSYANESDRRRLFWLPLRIRAGSRISVRFMSTLNAAVIPFRVFPTYGTQLSPLLCDRIETYGYVLDASVGGTIIAYNTATEIIAATPARARWGCTWATHVDIAANGAGLNIETTDGATGPVVLPGHLSSVQVVGGMAIPAQCMPVMAPCNVRKGANLYCKSFTAGDAVYPASSVLITLGY